MEIILKNLPETNEEVFLIIEPSLLTKNNKIIYNIYDESNENFNEIIVSEKKYKYTKIYNNIDKSLFENLITNQINMKSNISLLILIDNRLNETQNNAFSSFLDNLNNLIGKNFFDKNNIKQILYNFYKINLEANNFENILNNKIINKDSESFLLLDINSNEKDDITNQSVNLLKIRFDYLDNLINISSSINIYFIKNSFEKILPLFSINKKEKEIIILKEKIDYLLLTEKEIKEKLGKINSINENVLQDINNYKNEIINYFENFVKKIDIERKENKNKNISSNKNNLNDLIKEAKFLLDIINKEQFKNREKEIYQKYIKIYSNNNQKNNFDLQELKNSINKFNNLNEELLEFFEKEKIHREREKKERNKEKEISKLKQKILKLEQELQSEKNKNQKNNSNNIVNTNAQPKKINPKPRSLSNLKIDNTINTNNNQINIYTLEKENKKLKEKISELKETISNLQSKNQSLLAANENLLKESNKAKDNVTLKDYKRGENSLYSSPKNIKVKKDKIMNKTKTKYNISNNGNSLLLLKKIQEENKEFSKQLKDFNAKNLKLELSLKEINNTEINSNKNHNSLLYYFTENKRGELKNIEKKFGLTKNK